MTNEEIEKRFLFDLETGIFERYNYRYDNNIVSFVSNENNRHMLVILDKLLQNIGGKPFESHYSLQDKIAVDVNVISKKYYFYSEILTCPPYEEIPDYIKDYQLWLMRKLKKDSYLI